MSQKYELFGKFILLDKVAAGGMAEVYRAKSPGAEGIGKILAIKRILPQFTSNSEFIDMFKTEAKIAINLTQANIAQIFEFGEDKSQFYLVMEYIDGRNLRQVLSRCSKLQKALTIEQCVFAIAQVANGLDYAHRCLDKDTGGPLNIIHRDMSPQNIMLSFEGEVKIVDFGIAKAESKIENTRAGTLKGKFGYMSPEQAEGLDLDSRTDIFSTGIVLWELLSGERLFVANNEVNTIRKIKECQIPSLKKINPNIHEELERITMKALAKDRSLRYQTAAELHRDLSRFLYKVNPEFTQHDLAISVKTLFKEEILEDRKKIMDYARISVPAPPKAYNPPPLKTSGGSRFVSDDGPAENTKTITHTGDLATQSTAAVPTMVTREKRIQASAEKAEARANAESRKAEGDHQELEWSGFEGVEIAKTSQPQAQFRTQTQNAFGRGTKIHHSGLSSRLESPFIKNLPKIVLAFVMIAGGYYFFTNPYRMQQVVNIIGESLDYVQNEGRRAIAGNNQTSLPSVTNKPQPTPATQKAMGRLMVHSLPAGATLEVNGKQSGVTPVEINVEQNSKIALSLKRDGYITYVKEYFITNNVDEITATLQKAIVGYLNIDVRPFSADIYLNGVKLAERSPITRYAVPADKRITVRAVNPLSNTFDQQTITVKEDTVKSVQLFLRKSN